MDLDDVKDTQERHVRVKCSVMRGRIGLNSLSGLNLLQGNGEDLSRTIIFEGSLKNANNALYRIRYLLSGDDDGVNDDEFTISVNDLGSHGDGGEKITEHTIHIEIDS